MDSRLHTFVANVAEESFAPFTNEEILSTDFSIYRSARRTPTASLDVNIGIVLHPNVLFNHLQCNFQRQQSAFVRPMIRILFEVFLTLGCVITVPAEVLPAPGALYM
jgi:hypothetical protein